MRPVILLELWTIAESFHQSASLVMERMNLAIYLGDFLKTADLSRVRISCMKLKKYSKDRFFLMVWNMIT